MAEAVGGEYFRGTLLPLLDQKYFLDVEVSLALL